MLLRTAGLPADYPLSRTLLNPVNVAEYIEAWLRHAYLPKEEWDELPQPVRLELEALPHLTLVLERLVELKLLTQYQADRLDAGTSHGLVLGNYRVLDRLGAGGMGVVFLAEHCFLRRRVAIKVMPSRRGNEHHDALVRRFLNEVRLIAQLQHPNIIWALDTGELDGDDDTAPVLYYHVMEYVPGKNLEDLVTSEGPMPIASACDVIYQIASALVETDKHGLVHRDIKPSNILVTPEGQAKLLDFGLARRHDAHLTQPGVVLGTVDYVSPEQVQDATKVDIRADIYGLGGTLFWCLTGQPPFATKGSLQQLLLARLTQAAPSARALRPEIPAVLNDVVGRMMASDPENRFPCPASVMRALLPFLKTEGGKMPYLMEQSFDQSLDVLPGDAAPSAPTRSRALVVDDEDSVRKFCRAILEAEGFQCEELSDGQRVLEKLRATPFDTVLLDVQMPKMDGGEVLELLRATAPVPNLKIIMMSGRATTEEMSQMMLAGADDFLTKPLSVVHLKARVNVAMRLKQAQDRADMLNHRLIKVNQHLEHDLQTQNCDLLESRNAVVMSLAELLTYRGLESAAHLQRIQAYARCLAQELAALPAFKNQIDQDFVATIEGVVPLHDIGMIGLPEHILMKPSRLDADERLAVQTHTTIGAEILQKIARRNGLTAAFLQTAIDIARHHHERWDGQGYPDRLKGTDIPLAARLVAVADVYDALRSRRPHKPPLNHAAAAQLIEEASSGHFDPQILQAFHVCKERFDEIFKRLPD